MAFPQKLKLIRVAALGFVLFLIIVIIIADCSEKYKWWPFIERIPFGDKLGHIGLFGTLCFLCNLAFPSRRFGYRPLFITKTTLVLLVIISLEELSQLFIASRHCDFLDWLSDLIGLAAGQTAADLYKHVFRKAKLPDKTFR